MRRKEVVKEVADFGDVAHFPQLFFISLLRRLLLGSCSGGGCFSSRSCGCCGCLCCYVACERRAGGQQDADGAGLDVHVRDRNVHLGRENRPKQRRQALPRLRMHLAFENGRSSGGGRTAVALLLLLLLLLLKCLFLLEKIGRKGNHRAELCRECHRTVRRGGGFRPVVGCRFTAAVAKYERRGG